ncbi:LGFP repeat-containing protein [Nonomuraea sp. NPDC050451]|uniref:LGFP repeat-containing protein n=1 Tax=Nonomuraea sp. NPDC050451 TaxID=3364364 RepID=UPI003797AE0B
MNRSTRTLAAAVTFAATVASGLAAAAPAQAGTCAIQPYGLIGDYWRSLGAGNGPLGCPTGKEYSLPNQNGRKQRFEGGQVAFSPDQGTNMIVAAYESNGKAVFRWGPTSPFNYDYWRIHWTASPNIGLIGFPGHDVTVRTSSRTAGKITGYPPAGVTNSAGYHATYTFWIQGCDDKLTGDTCRQGYTIPVSVNA